MEIVYSYLFVFGVIGLAGLLTKIGWLNDEGGRKFIHIGVGNWMIVVPLLFDNIWLAVIPPVTFVGLNYLSYRYDLIRAMERKEKSTGDLGSVYYAISLVLVTVLDASLFGTFTLAVLPILVLAYGDGLAAIVGTVIPSKQLVGTKTIYGTATMFVVTLIVAFVMMSNLWMVFLVATVATLIELFSPRGIDNLTLPLGLYLLLYLL